MIVGVCAKYYKDGYSVIRLFNLYLAARVSKHLQILDLSSHTIIIWQCSPLFSAFQDLHIISRTDVVADKAHHLMIAVTFQLQTSRINMANKRCLFNMTKILWACKI